MNTWDELFYLMGDEDTDVGAHCRLCDRGGLPVANYSFGPGQPYKGTDVVDAHSLSEFLAATGKHAADVHNLQIYPFS